jgi:hypothetical protein
MRGLLDLLECLILQLGAGYMVVFTL